MSYRRFLIKRLLIAPLLIALNGCSNGKELIVKTDLGEKYIVKDSAVKVTNWTKSDAIRGIKDQHPVEKCIERKILSSDECQSGENIFSDDVTKHLKEEKIIINSDIQIPYKLVRFRPIFVDVNNDRSANTYFNVSCLNYSAISTLEDSYIKALTKASIEHLDNIPDRSSDLAIEDLKEKVCDKYAKFNLKEKDPELANKDSSEIGKLRDRYAGIQWQEWRAKGSKTIIWVADYAAKEGIKIGDIIVAVNDTEIKGMSTDEVFKLFMERKIVKLTLKEKGKLKTVNLSGQIRY